MKRKSFSGLFGTSALLAMSFGVFAHAQEAKSRPASPSPGTLSGEEEIGRSQRPPNADCTRIKTLVRLDSAETARTAGLRFAPVERHAVIETIQRNAEIAFDATRYARLAGRTSGVVIGITRDLGDPVAAGETVAIVDSPALGAAKADMLQDLETLNLWSAHAERERRLVSQGVGTQREALEAETKRAESRIEVARARQQLRSLGLTEEQIDTVEREGDTSSGLPVVSPLAGVLVERSAVVGDLVDPASPFLAVADMSRVWAMVDVFPGDLTHIKTGQKVALVVDGLRGESFTGQITWIGAELDARTRTLKARAELPNEDGLLRAGMFGRASIVSASDEPTLVVPTEAVQWDGCCNVVFVKAHEAGTLFEPRQVRLGYRSADVYEVRSGLQEGEVIVTEGSYLLKTEILKGAIGAGCCEVGHLDK